MAKEAKIKFDYTLQKNICMYPKRQEGQCTTMQMKEEFNYESSFILEAMLKLLKRKDYISYDDHNVYLSDNLYYLLQA